MSSWRRRSRQRRERRREELNRGADYDDYGSFDFSSLSDSLDDFDTFTDSPRRYTGGRSRGRSRYRDRPSWLPNLDDEWANVPQVDVPEPGHASTIASDSDAPRDKKAGGEWASIPQVEVPNPGHASTISTASDAEGSDASTIRPSTYAPPPRSTPSRDYRSSTTRRRSYLDPDGTFTSHRAFDSSRDLIPLFPSSTSRRPHSGEHSHRSSDHSHRFRSRSHCHPSRSRDRPHRTSYTFPADPYTSSSYTSDPYTHDYDTLASPSYSTRRNTRRSRSRRRRSRSRRRVDLGLNDWDYLDTSGDPLVSYSSRRTGDGGEVREYTLHDWGRTRSRSRSRSRRDRGAGSFGYGDVWVNYY